jgi:hypothetical protein
VLWKGKQFILHLILLAVNLTINRIICIIDVNGYVPFVLEKSHPSFLFHESPYIFPQEQHDGCYKWRMNCLPFQSTKVHPVLTGLPVVHFVQFCRGLMFDLCYLYGFMAIFRTS